MLLMETPVLSLPICVNEPPPSTSTSNLQYDSSELSEYHQSLGSKAPIPIDEFETFFQEADKTAEIQKKAAEARRGSLPTHTLAPPGDALRRAASCKCAPTRKRSTRNSSRSPARRPSPENDSESRYTAESNLKAPIISDTSVSQPQSRTQSWKNMKRPRSFREFPQGNSGSNHHIDHDDSPGSRRDSVAFEESVNAKLEELRMLEEDDCCVVRSFAVTPGRGLVNRGDSVKRKTRSMSKRNAAAASSTSASTTTVPYPSSNTANANATSTGQSTASRVVGEPDDQMTASARSSLKQRYRALSSSQGHRENEVAGVVGSTATVGKKVNAYKVMILGDHGVGKTALIQQFMTSEYMGAVDSSFDGCDRSVSVQLNGIESMIQFLDGSKDIENENDIAAYIVVFSSVDHQSLSYAADQLLTLKMKRKAKGLPKFVTILVANKTDLVRKRKVSVEEGRNIATQNKSKYIELSAALNHKVDDLLVGIVAQIRLHVKTADHGSGKTAVDNNNGGVSPSSAGGATGGAAGGDRRRTGLGCIPGFVGRLFRIRKRPVQLSDSCDDLQKL